jgi:hypothetical protein
VSGFLKFPIFEEISISTKFRQNLFFWKKFTGLQLFEVLRILLTNTYVYLQYASSSTWFRAIWIFSKFCNFVNSIGVSLKNSNFQKCPKRIINYNYIFLNIMYNISVSGDLKFPIFKKFQFPRHFVKIYFFGKNSPFATFWGFTNTSHK